jgi:hypothetical protein
MLPCSVSSQPFVVASAVSSEPFVVASVFSAQPFVVAYAVSHRLSAVSLLVYLYLKLILHAKFAREKPKEPRILDISSFQKTPVKNCLHYYIALNLINIL